MLLNNYDQALQITNEEAPAFEQAKLALNISDTDLEKWQMEEREYFQNLGSEPEYNVHTLAYVELLEKYCDAK